MADATRLIGTTIGSYRVAEVLGVGGMGAVYLGEHPEIESRVAIKVLLPEFVSNEEIVKRFLDEARAVNRIGHNGIVRIHDAAFHDELGVYLVMEYLEGETLYQLHKREGKLAPERVARILLQAAGALAASHEKGIVHRDLKPANLYLVLEPELPGGLRVKVLDFGIAKLIEDRDPMSGRTETGAFLGSPMFMSPEQCLDSKDVDHRTDIYALGAMGYHALSGRYPFEAPSIGRLILMHQKEKPEPLPALNPDVPAPLAAVIGKALEADREQRYQTMTELREALQGALEQMGSERLDSSQPSLTVGGEDQSMPPTVIEGKERGTTTLSSSVGEQAPLSIGAPGRPRSMVPVAVGGAVVTVLAVVLFIALRGDEKPAPEPATPPTAAAPQAPDSSPTVEVAPDAATPKTAQIKLELSPPSARVILDGKETAQNPLALEVSTEHTIQVTAPGHEPLEQKLTVAGDQTLKLELKRAKKPTASKARKPPPKGRRPARKPESEPKTDTKTKTKKGPKKPFFDDL
jgi:serine/threonine-protein kinase